MNPFDYSHDLGLSWKETQKVTIRHTTKASVHLGMFLLFIYM